MTVGQKSSRAALATWTRALESTGLNENGDWTTLLSVVREVASHGGDRPALIGEDSQLTYRELVELADAYSMWAISEDARPADVVSLLMPNCPDYVAIWCGLAQTGCTVALVNTNLVGEALAHAIRVSHSSRLIVAASLLQHVEVIRPALPVGLRIFVHGAHGLAGRPRIDLDVLAWIGRTSDLSDRLPRRRDRALLIGTSGTTGLPKAANITHARVLEWSFWFAGMMNACPDDRIYNCLPMYHSVGGIVAVGAVLSRGGCVVIRRRFSASFFWEDVATSGCTIFQYIGELCRYLVNNPTRPSETTHRLRLCCGNGLGRGVWERFQTRFHIPNILEFYAATEGNVSLYNCESRPGAVGRIPAFLKHRFPVELVKTDDETGEPCRDTDGSCIRCAADEPGEAIGLIESGASAPRHFDGYTDREASARKTLADVFDAGDRWFRTGDLMRRDKAGYFYFVDRLGDTFRWKGENVSTSEVSEVIGFCPGVCDCVVFGVTLPGRDGRVGAAAITCNARFSFEDLTRHLQDNLPQYARPSFVRVCDQIETTGTFKFVKAALVREGLFGAAADGQLWFLDQQAAAYVNCDERLLAEIWGGTVRV